MAMASQTPLETPLQRWIRLAAWIDGLFVLQDRVAAALWHFNRMHPAGMLPPTSCPHPPTSLDNRGNGSASWIRCLRCKTRIAYFTNKPGPEKILVRKLIGASHAALMGCDVGHSHPLENEVPGASSSSTTAQPAAEPSDLQQMMAQMASMGQQQGQLLEMVQDIGDRLSAIEGSIDDDWTRDY